MDPHLTDEQLDLLVTELDRIIADARYPLSARIRALREIPALLKLYPERPPLAPSRICCRDWVDLLLTLIDPQRAAFLKRACP